MTAQDMQRRDRLAPLQLKVARAVEVPVTAGVSRAARVIGNGSLGRVATRIGAVIRPVGACIGRRSGRNDRRDDRGSIGNFRYVTHGSVPFSVGWNWTSIM